MLTKADDYPVHQLASPISEVGSSRNFYDRYFFNGYTKDKKVYFAAALCVYPNLNIMDAAFTVAYEGKQHNCRASRILNEERLNTKVGSIEVNVLDALQRLEIKVDDKDANISADLIFDGIYQVMQEPKMKLYSGPRLVMDTCRMVQQGVWEGQINLQGVDLEIDRETTIGTRDRSWGVRPVGTLDSQPIVPLEIPQFYWLWNPTHFDGFSTHIYFVDNESGKTINGHSVLQDKNNSKIEELSNLEKRVSYKKGSRRVDSLIINAERKSGKDLRMTIKPENKIFMCGLGYMHQEWGHGHYKGENETTYDSYNLEEDPHDPPFLHIQSVCTVELVMDKNNYKGLGVLEELILGPHKPSGFKDLFDR
ncbi:MAG: hypothetical protein VX215_04165 [Pseudomonadota bacterium]|nr:hypothetical protein [Pseudomonadota bacterium]